MLIKRLSLKKVLSFNDSTVELGQLNVLIGPNAVGKTNLIEVIALLQSAPNSISREILRGGGVRQWIWLGDSVPSPIATIDCQLRLARGRQVGPLTYHLEFSEAANGFTILKEQIGKSDPDPGSDGLYLTRTGIGAEFGSEAVKLIPNAPRGMSVSPSESVLSQFKSLADPTRISELANHVAQIRIFREFRTGAQSPIRYGISTSVPKDTLTDGSDNLALVLNDLDLRGVHDRITDYLRRFCERFEDVKVGVGEGLARIHLREAGLAELLSAPRMSDGTLKFLSLWRPCFIRACRSSCVSKSRRLDCTRTPCNSSLRRCSKHPVRCS
jgi:predicted ATPase